MPQRQHNCINDQKNSNEEKVKTEEEIENLFAVDAILCVYVFSILSIQYWSCICHIKLYPSNLFSSVEFLHTPKRRQVINFPVNFLHQTRLKPSTGPDLSEFFELLRNYNYKLAQAANRTRNHTLKLWSMSEF